MPQIIFTLTTPELNRLVTAITETRGYQVSVPNPAFNPSDPTSTPTIPNPISKNTFTKDHYVNLMKTDVRNYEREKVIKEAEEGFTSLEVT